MKSFLRSLSFAFITSALSVTAFAAQSGTFTISSSQGGVIELSGTQEHDVYENVYIPRTCSREVFSHYDTVCHNERSEVCHTAPGGRRECTPITRRECHDVARYRTEYYDCSYWDRVYVGTQIDYYVNATIDLSVALPEGANANEVIRAAIDRNSGTVDFSAPRTSGEFLVFFEEDSNTQVNGNQKTVQVKASATLVPAKGIRNAFRAGIQGVDLNAGTLTFEMPTHVFSKGVSMEMRIKRERSMWFGKELFEGAVASNAIEIAEGTQTTRYTIDLKKLNLKEPLTGEKEYKVWIKVGLAGSTLRGCLNEGDLGEFDKAEITLKDQKL